MISEDIINSQSKTQKHPKCNRVLLGCKFGYLYEYSLIEERIVHDFGKILDRGFSLIATTFDKKYLFLCAEYGGLVELDISTGNQVKNFGVENTWQCAVTNDNRFLITVPDGRNVKLTKHSIETKQQLHTWDSNVNEVV